MAAAGTSSSADAARCYLSRVYSAVGAAPHALDDNTATQLLQTLRVLYKQEAAACNIDTRATKPQCRSGQRELIRWDNFSFPGLLSGCNTSSDCDVQAAHYTPRWADDIVQGFSAHNWLEVHHFAIAGKAGTRQPKAWREFLDGGLAGWWYYVAPGSGIFYHTGATRVATTKPAMLALLLREWAASAALAKSSFLLGTLQQLMVPWSPDKKPYYTPAEAATIMQKFHDQGRLYRQPLHLSDAWDALIIRVGRLLGYDTLIFTTELDSVKWHVSSSLVDLRTPFGFESEPFNKRVDLVERGKVKSHSLVVPVGATVLDEVRARAWVDDVAARDVLCVGMLPYKSGSAAPFVRCSHRDRCNFTHGPPTVRLACRGHVSWTLRDEIHPGCYKY